MGSAHVYENVLMFILYCISLVCVIFYNMLLFITYVYMLFAIIFYFDVMFFLRELLYSDVIMGIFTCSYPFSLSGNGYRKNLYVCNGDGYG
jgi:hypothetical protein